MAAGRAVYSQQLHVYDPITGNSTDFTTHFSFKISPVDPQGQDGLAFFLAPNGSLLPEYASGGCLALFSQCDNFTIPRKDMVAVEFDTYNNTWDENDNEHVGININSIRSERKQDLSRTMKNGVIVDAIIRYDSKANNLSVSWSFPGDPFVTLSHQVNLTKLLPEWVSIGFAAGSAYYFETHEILSWEFTTELLPAVPGSTSSTSSAGLIVGCVVGGLFLVCGIVLVFVFVWRKRSRGKGKEGVKNVDPVEREIEQGKGPKRFSYNDLVRATNNFAEQGKLGEGGFGGVYKGFLSELQQFIAVKKVSRPSDQGKKAYTTEGSDVFSFGIVALEIACGKRSTEAEYEGPHVPIAGWVWDSYGNERLHEVVDKTLLEFDMKEIECLLIVGLWCAHPDLSLRPSIRQALQVLNFDAPLPNLPKKMPVANYNIPSAATRHSGSTDSAPMMSLSSINMGR
ncbi:hypothetical protein FH972_004815 [Carpinus fangiana]|uniref:non-specific serine/threonine protein kinase n=1 Tax=Carpinus fangiana TaxID=176857 RepID=A0A5N6QQ92_9ROSI|nr:hypothetical protein FH972_004815 [Carpinus fangiana]